MNKHLRFSDFKMSFARGVTLSLLLILLSGFSYGASLFGDQKKNFVIKNKSVQQAIEQILDQSGYYVVYAVDNIKSLGSITIELTNITTEEALEKVLSSKGLQFIIKENNVIIQKATPQPAQQSKSVNVKGRVINKKSKTPIVGATVIVTGTTNGSITDNNGEFTFKAQTGEKVEVTYIGMVATSFTVTPTSTNVVVEMEDDAMAVDDVIVTGIFNKAKESYTGSVTTISSKDLKMYKGQNMLATLKNIDPSLNIVANNLTGSNPNALPEVNIRGNSSLPKTVKELNEGTKAQLNAPLVIMDGFEISLQKLMDYNDEEIHSINIMKDASATAIYGSRGANGVIVVVTKTPVEGKLRVSIKAGIDIEMPDLSSYNLMNAREKLDLEYMNGIYDSDTPSGSIDKMKQYYEVLDDVLRGVDTYWLGQPVRTGVGQTYNINLTGGNQEFKWSANVGYKNTMGTMKDSKRDNFSGTLTLSYTFKNLIFKNQTQITSDKGTESKYGKFSDYAKMNPYWKIYDEKGEMIKAYRPGGAGFTVANPLYNSTLNVLDDKTTTEIINNFAIEWDIVESLKFRAQFGISKKFGNVNKFYPAEHTKFVEYKFAQNNKKGSYEYTNSENMNYDGNATLTYSKIFNEKHQLYVGFDYSMSQKKGLEYLFEAEGFPSDNLDLLFNALQYKEGTKPSGKEELSRRVGFTGNLNYTYADRYFVDLSYRIDGSSMFGSKNRFAPFWSAGIGWNLHNEKFLKDSKVLTNMRLKGSYGQTGSQQFDAYQALSTLQYYTDKKYVMWNAAELMGLGNENLKWQTTDQMNIGIEFGLWENRILGSLDYYDKRTSSLLSQMDIPLANGFESYVDNVGSIKNSGYEATLSGFLIRDYSRNISWSITGKIAYNKNEVTKLSDAIKNQNEEYLKENVEINNLLYEGYPMNAIYAVHSMGIDPSTGNEVFLDRNGVITKTWSSSDKVYMGISEPKYRGNLSTLFSYKELSVNLSFGYHFGGKQYNNTMIDKVEVARYQLKNNLDKRVLEDRWQTVGDVKFYKRIDDKDTRATSRFVMSDNVFELQSASVSYRLSTQKLIEKAKIQSITFGLNMSDIFYVSSVKRERGIEYPFARRVGMTVSLMF